MSIASEEEILKQGSKLLWKHEILGYLKGQYNARTTTRISIANAVDEIR